MLTILLLRCLTFLLILCSVLSPLTALSKDIPANPPAILLAEHYRSTINPADYLVSEKLDGVRAIWDGQTLSFRSGQRINAPSWFIDKLPTHALDGELWMGRRKFDKVSAATRRLEPQESEWRKISYQVYELPGATGSFRDRVHQLHLSLAKINVPWLRVVKQFQVADDAELQRHLQHIVKAGGEGLMLHRMDAPWQTGRSDVLLKLKKMWDAEAKVVGHLPGKGKYQGKLGALLVEMPDGKRFELGTGLKDKQRTDPPPIGSIITYRYRDLTPQGVPRFASFLRLRD